MNFLAHTFLSCDDEELLLGNFLADFMKNKEVTTLPPRVRQGVELHRKIDSYTDKHPIVRQGTKRLRAKHGKYSPVIIDVFYDYLLARHWHLYSSQSLDQFAQTIYAILKKNLLLMPERLHSRILSMVAHNWLMGYSTLEGIAYTFERMKKRVTYPIFLDNATQSLKNDLLLLDEEFNQFFPEVQVYVKAECWC